MTKQADKQPLVKKLVEILKGIGPVEKAHRNPHFGYNYTSEGQIMALLGPRLAASGILFTTSVEDVTTHIGEGKAGVYATVKTLHTFLDTDTGDKLEVRSAGMGWDTGDKALPKAITGATKSALMKNFMTTDETDPENEVRSPEANGSKTGQGKHRQTKEYEEETGADNPKSATDLLELKAFLTENKIPDGFLLRLLTEKGLIDGHTKNVAQLKPGVLRRCLSPNSKENLVRAWKEFQAADEESGSQTAPEPKKRGAKKETVRTNEGDQTRGRKLAMPDLDPTDVLSQDGYENWREVKVHFGTQRGEKLGGMSQKSVAYWLKWTPKPHPKTGKLSEKDVLLDCALFLAEKELGGGE